MVKRIGTIKRKSRHKLTKEGRTKGKISTTSYFQKLEIGTKVVLKAEPAIQKGCYATRFYGRTGIIKTKEGRCYNVQFKDGNKYKVITVHPVHLKQL